MEPPSSRGVKRRMREVIGRMCAELRDEGRKARKELTNLVGVSARWNMFIGNICRPPHAHFARDLVIYYAIRLSRGRSQKGTREQ